MPWANFKPSILHCSPPAPLPGPLSTEQLALLGLVAVAVWLHFLPPAQAAALLVSFGPIVSVVGVWKFRAAIQWRRLAPFLIGGVIGVPIGGEVLRWTAPGNLRIGIAGAVQPVELLPPK
jgi:hypothetical protein